MARRNHKELWEQLKVLILHGKQKRYTRRELYELMTNLEVSQLAQDPFAALLGAMEEAKEAKK